MQHSVSVLHNKADRARQGCARQREEADAPRSRNNIRNGGCRPREQTEQGGQTLYQNCGQCRSRHQKIYRKAVQGIFYIKKSTFYL